MKHNLLPTSLLDKVMPFTHKTSEIDLKINSKQLEELMAKYDCRIKVITATQYSVFKIFSAKFFNFINSIIPMLPTNARV